MTFSCNSRLYILVWNLKQKAFVCRIYGWHRRYKESLQPLYNYALNCNQLRWSPIPSSNRVFLSISGLFSGLNVRDCSPITVSIQKSYKGFLYFITQFLSTLWDFVQTILRAIQLICTFTPLLLLYPLTKISSKLKSLWFKMLLIGIGFSGPIIIKLGQWASTRKDLFSEELCFCLSKLQRKTTPHSWYYTKKSLEYAYGPNWRDIFVCFDNRREPIGSGCCAQVYKAWIKTDKISTVVSHLTEEFQVSGHFLWVEVLEALGFGHLSTFLKRNDSQLETEFLIPVAVKVRHPQMERMFRQDLNILKFFARAITQLIPSFKWLSLCECMDEFSRVMKSQVNFYIEAENLKRFSNNFKGSTSVKFPHPIDPLTRSNILVETFEEGEPIDDLLSEMNDKTKKYLAKVGVNTILKMIFEDNFIHGDLHPGNLLVQEKDAYKYIPFPLGESTKRPITLVILDCGIVSSLDERGKKCLKDVFAAVARGDGERVAELFLENSNHQCTDISSFKMEMKEIVDSALNKQVTLHQVDVSVLMNKLFSTMIHHRVKVDSSFSSVILAIVVIEGLGRSLDPTIDILERAKPFLFSRIV